MSNLKSILRDVGYFSVGAAAVLIEAGSKAAKALVRKGEATLRDNQDTVDDLKRKAKDLGEKAKAAVEKAAAKAEKPPVDASQLTPEARAELRRQLDEADEADAACENECTCEAECSCEADAACENECSCKADEPIRPVAPDVIYHAEGPADEEAADEENPENTVNG